MKTAELNLRVALQATLGGLLETISKVKFRHSDQRVYFYSVGTSTEAECDNCSKLMSSITSSLKILSQYGGKS